MSAAAMHLAVARLPWQRALRGSPWTSLAILLVLPASVALISALLRVRMDLAGAMVLLAVLVTVWYLQVDGWLSQNLPRLARHVPGQLRALRLQVLAGGLGISLLAAAVLASVSSLALAQWLPITVLGTLLLAWLARMPLLWALIWIPQLGFQAIREALLASMQHQAGAAGAVALLVLGLWPLVGQGGGLHRWLTDGMQRWRAAALAAQRGERVSGVGPWAWSAALGRFFAWPLHVWRRRLERQARPQNAVARVDAWLSGSGHWSLQLWALVLMLLGAALLTLVLTASLRNVHLHHVLSNLGGFGLGIMVMLQVSSTQKQQRLLATRREQALLALLPAVPAGAGLGRSLRQRWVRQAGLTSLFCLLLFAAVLQFSRPGFVALTGSLLAMLLFAPLWLLRDWSQLSKASPFAQAGLMVGGAVLALASTFQLGVGRWLPLLALPLALLAFAHQWRKARQFPSQFPVGRRYSGNSVK